jgi:glutathione S-transferase
LILQKLEAKFPDGALGAQDPDHKALEMLLSKWMVEGTMFPRAGQLLPLDIPLMRDPKFQRDRQQFNGRSWDSAQIAKNRPEAAAHIRDAFEFLETTLLADGRDWILKTEKPSLADIEGACVGPNPVTSTYARLEDSTNMHGRFQRCGHLNG